MPKQFPEVDCSRGAPFGRRHAPTLNPPVRCFRVRMVSGDYDDGGAYWGGGGLPLWCIRDEDGNEQFYRASCRLGALSIGGYTRDDVHPRGRAGVPHCFAQAEFRRKDDFTRVFRYFGGENTLDVYNAVSHYVSQYGKHLTLVETRFNKGVPEN